MAQHLGLELAQIHPKNLRQLGQTINGRFQITRIDPHRLHRRTHRQRLAMSIQNASAMRRNFLHPLVTHLALFFEEIALGNFQINRTPEHDVRQQEKQPQHHDHTPLGTPRRKLNGYGTLLPHRRC